MTRRATPPLPFTLNIAITNAWVSQLFDQELEKRGIAPFQSGTLMMLHRHQPVTPSDLQAVMGVPSTTLRNRVNELVAAGLVERVPNPQDGRSHLLRTTSAAQDVVKASAAAARQVQRMLAKRGIDVEDGLVGRLDDLRAATQDLVTGPPASGRGSLTTGPW
jgi:DNA-binding MarR family transcriptional regulator